ncbi:MAG TPA: hypothetical protein VKM55_14395 [Candidatus Lokiarchaeia archaeon]|nr:hypothetical protein [Candidatus Lokiarchaeia archaeon]
MEQSNDQGRVLEIQDQPESSSLDQSGWFSKPVLKQGYFISIAIQFFTITVPFAGWKVVLYPGVLNAYMDIIIVLVAAIVMIAIVAICMTARVHGLDPDTLPGKFARLIKVTAVIGNMAGILFVIYSIFVGFKYALLPVSTFNASGIIPFLLLAIATSMQACVVIVAWRCFAWTGAASKVIAWAIMFSCIPAGFGLLFTIDPLYGGAMPAALFASSVMTGVSAFWIDAKDISGPAVHTVGPIRDLDSSMATEIKGTNVTGFLFLLGMLLFNFTSPFMNPGSLMSSNQALLVLLAIGIAAGIAVVGNWLGSKTLKARLYAAIAINFDAAAMAFALDVLSPVRALALAISTGIVGGLAAEPVIRAFLKFNLTRKGFAQILTTMLLGMFFGVLFMLLSAAYTTQHDTLVPYANIVFPIMLVLASVPAFFTANYSKDLVFDSKKKPVAWLLHAALIVNFFMIVLLIVFPVFAEL